MVKKAVAFIFFLSFLFMEKANALSYEFQRDYFVALHYLARNQKEKGKALLQQLIQETPLFFDGYIRLYEIALSDKDWEQALFWLEKAKALPEKRRLIVDADLFVFQIDQAIKDTKDKQAQEVAKEQKKAQKKEEPFLLDKASKVWKVRWEKGEGGKIKIYKGSQDGIESEDTIVLFSDKTARFFCKLEELKKFYLVMTCPDFSLEEKSVKIALFKNVSGKRRQ